MRLRLGSAFKSVVILSLISFIHAVLAQPALDRELLDVEAQVGSSIAIKCDLNYYYGYSILWAKEDPYTYISRNEAILVDNDETKYSIEKDESEQSFTLEISDLDLDDSSTYLCLYSNAVATVTLGFVTVTVLETEKSVICRYVTVPAENEIIVDLTCNWISVQSNSTTKITRNGEILSSDFILEDRLIRRQILERSDQLDEFECQWHSPVTGQIETCNFERHAAADMALGVEPYQNSVTLGQTARFTCQTTLQTSSADSTTRYSWTLYKDGHPVDLGTRQKGFMKQSMRVLSVELADDNIMAMCTVHTSNGQIAQGVGLLRVQPSTSVSSPVTTIMTTSQNSTISAPRETPITIAIIIVIVILLLIIAILFVVIVLLTRSKSNRESCLAIGQGINVSKHPDEDAQFAAANVHYGQDIRYADSNPDIIRDHSSKLPLYAMPDKFRKSNNIESGPRKPPKHYLPRRESYGGANITETSFIESSSNMEQYPNPYEDIDSDALNDARRIRSKSHTISGFDRHDVGVQSNSPTTTPRRYRVIKSSSSLSALYTKPDKPLRNPPSRLDRKSWDLPGSLENLCNAAAADSRSIPSSAVSICEGDGYACVADENSEGGTMASDYMPMNPVWDDPRLTAENDNDITQESEISQEPDVPLYARI